MDREERRARLAAEAEARRQNQVDVLDRIIWQAYTAGQPIGDALMAQKLHLDWTYGQPRFSSIAKIRDLMKDVRIQFPKRHPGYAILRPGDGLVEVTDDPDNRQLMREVITSLRTSATKRERANAQLDPVRHNSTDPTQHQLAATVATLAKLTGQLDDIAREVQAIHPAKVSR